MNPQRSTVARVCLVVFAVFTAYAAAARGGPVPVAIGAALTIAALAAMPAPVAAWGLCVVSNVLTLIADLCQNTARLAACFARRLCYHVAEQFDYSSRTGPLSVELGVGGKYLSITAENFDLTPGMLEQVTREVFQRCIELDTTFYEPEHVTTFESPLDDVLRRPADEPTATTPGSPVLSS